MNLLTYKIPEAVQAAYEAGSVELFGAVLKNTSTGQIVAHVQPTSVLDTFLNTATNGVVSTVSQGFSPLGAIGVVQNQVIGQQLRAMGVQLDLLQSLQIGSLAVSGLGLGVSIAGFAMVAKRLNGIECQLVDLSAKVDLITQDRRLDEIKRTFVDIRTEIDAVETLESRRDKAMPGHAAQQRLALLAGHLEVQMKTHLEGLSKKGLVREDLELLWSLMAAMRLCHEMGVRALYTMDDLGGAAALSERQAKHSIHLLESFLTPDAMARLAAFDVKDRHEAEQVRQEILPLAQGLRDGLHQSISGLSSLSTLSGALHSRGASGPDFLKEVIGQEDEPLLYLLAA